MQMLKDIILGMIVFIIAGTLHEYAHAFVAFLLGDDTAKNNGRLSLNPLVHIDPIGSLAFPVIARLTGAPLFGWMRPVPVNPYNFQNSSRDQALVSLAGPLCNLLQTALGLLLFKIIYDIYRTTGQNVYIARIMPIFQAYYLVNVMLMVFNLLPCPPLDGGWILRHFLPTNGKILYDRIYPWGIILLYVLMFSGLLRIILIFFNQLFIKVLLFFFSHHLLFAFLPLLLVAGLIFLMFRKPLQDVSYNRKEGWQPRVREDYIYTKLKSIVKDNTRLLDRFKPLLRKQATSQPFSAADQNRLAVLKKNLQASTALCADHAFEARKEDCLQCANYSHCIAHSFPD